jgi:large subunit ribosomal protein L20
MRVKRGVVRHRRHKKIRGLAKGFRGTRRTTFKSANQAVMKAGQHAFRDRRKKKRAFRSLWTIRLNAALRARGTSYAPFIAKMHARKVTLDRKTLSELAIHEPEVFTKVVEQIVKA